MRNLKKFLALVLSMMMVLSLVVTASANSIKDGNSQVFNDNNAIEPKFLEAVEVLNGMDVLKGDADASGTATGNFRPSATITRAEVAAMVFRLATGLTGAHDADHFAQYGNFSDVKDNAWYAGYVGYCANAGYIKGYEGEHGPFGPTDPVTGYQALAMILRAIGYGVNGEFEGRSWQVNVASIGQETHILDNINSTAFGGATLQQAARRDVVAEIYFQAAQVNKVVYTPAFGYQTTNVAAGGGNSASLGYENFGLVGEKRIVLGNQATGESATKLGATDAELFALTSNRNYTFVSNAGTYQLTRYDYPGKVIGDTSANYPTKTAPGVTIDLKSGLDLFGHEIKVWYNAKDVGVKQTYAYSDQATLTKMVYSRSNDINNLDNADVTNDKIAGLGSLANGAGFSVNKTDNIFVSDRYGRIITSLDDTGEVKAQNANEIHSASGFNSPKAANAANPAIFNGDEDDTTNHGGNAGDNGDFYMLISNNGGKKVDVVITLAAELAEINKHDTTASTKTLQLGWRDDLGDRYHTGNPTDSKFGVDNNGTIRMNSLTASSEKGLGELVTAWEIVGTAYDTDRLDQDTTSLNANQYFYQLNKIQQGKTAVVSTYEPDTGKVTLADGSVLNFTLLPIVDDAVPTPADGLHFYNGVEYTFYMDEMGRYVKAEQNNGYQFLYGTFADYEIGGLGTGTINYAVTGVNWDGEKQINLPMATIDNVPVSGVNYEALTITKKNLGTSNPGQVVGNEIWSGLYTGYRYNASTKDLWTNPGARSVNPDTDWSYNKANVANGWVDVNSDGSLLLTPNTRFIVVDGTGSATLNVQIFDGISAFLNGSDSVKIDTRIYDANRVYTGNDYNLYYRYIDDTFNNVDTNPSTGTDNHMVRTLILPKAAVTWSNMNTMYFTTGTRATGTLLANTSAADGIFQYVLYQNGVRGTYFVDTKLSGGVEPITDDVDVGDFFNLIEDRKINGVPVYRAEEIVSPIRDDVTTQVQALCNVNYKYEYFAVNNTSTARINGDVYNVTNAQVVNLSGTGTITNVQELNNAVSVGYDVTVAIVNNGLQVSLIYVTDVN